MTGTHSIVWFPWFPQAPLTQHTLAIILSKSLSCILTKSTLTQPRKEPGESSTPLFGPPCQKSTEPVLTPGIPRASQSEHENTECTTFLPTLLLLPLFSADSHMDVGLAPAQDPKPHSNERRKLLVPMLLQASIFQT